MGGIKYYQLAKGEEMPDEFCAVRDVGGEPSEYTFYVPEDENTNLRERITTQKQTIQAYRDESREWREVAERVQAENEKLRELVAEMFNACPMCVNCAHNHLTVGWYDRMRELGVDA